MSHTLTIRLDRDLADWLADEARKTRVPQGKIVRDALETAKARRARQPFMRFAGAVRGPRNLSTRKGFARE